MAIFHKIDIEETIQIDDKTRINGDQSFVTQDEAAITLMEIEPEAGNGYIDVTSEQYLDWQYATDGTKVISLRITTDGAPATKTKTIESISSTDDALFSSDQDLIEEEDDILDYVRDGRSSHLDKHRRAQEIMLDDLNDANIRDTSGDRLLKAAIVDIKEVKDWSIYQTLELIFDNQSNIIGDIFDDKARKYEGKKLRAQQNGFLRLDRSGDGLDESRVDSTAGTMHRRG